MDARHRVIQIIGWLSPLICINSPSSLNNGAATDRTERGSPRLDPEASSRRGVPRGLRARARPNISANLSWWLSHHLGHF
jgi:hypothetical protein